MGCLGFIIYRFNSLFNIPKWRAFVIAILCFLAGIPFFFVGDMIAVFGMACWVYGLIYGCIWCYKFCRDMDIRIKAEQDLYNPQHQQQEVMPPMNNPGNSRLFVPKPFDR